VSDIVSLIVTGLALLVTVASSYVAWQALQTARAASRPSSMHNLFVANQAALQYPELLLDVHGIDPATAPREARALVYFSTLLDGFAEVHGRVYGGDFARMAQVMKRDGDSLRRFLAIPANAARWDIIRVHSYGDFEPGFAAAVDDLVAYERGLLPQQQPDGG
jgi:hypothetical protein